MKPQVIGIGEVLIDFIATEPAPFKDATTFKKCFGGAPMNTLVGVVRLGISAGAVAAVGDDPFGQFLIRELKRNNVDTSHIIVKENTRTTISFVANEPMTGERTFFFYRKPWVRETSDSTLSPGDIDYSYISKAEIVHVSGFALSQNPSRKAILTAVKYAKKSGVKVSFDPTLRVDVWNSENSIRRLYQKMLKLADIATFSREEAEFMFKTSNPKKASQAALKYGLQVVGIKLGSEGSYLKTRSKDIFMPAYKVKAVDTTGAGDGWNAGLLVGLCRNWELERCAKIANAVGAMVVTRRGAIAALPTREEVSRFLEDHDVDLEV